MPLFIQKPEEKRLGIYVHIPFCKSKCEYCDFYSLGGSKERRLVDDYLQALADHIKETGKLCPGYEVDTIYFGGGTPSYFGGENLERILDEIHRHFHVSSEGEITLEANPDSLTLPELRRLLRAGFNRISIGVQCDNDEILKKLGRPHTFQQAKQGMQLARKAGFANISLDLMYGLPGQSLSAWKETVLRIIAMRPEHISCYGLKVEENTPLWSYHKSIDLPNDDTQSDMYLAAAQILEEYGYEQYEISNFAKKGFLSRHNMKYWTGGEYIGFGPSAASDFGGRRYTIEADIRAYIHGISNGETVLSESEEIPLRERAGEYVMLRLRTAKGIHGKEYERNFLLSFEPLETLLRRYEDQGLAEKRKERWRLTPKGWLLSNQIILSLIEAQSRSNPITQKR